MTGGVGNPYVSATRTSRSPETHGIPARWDLAPPTVFLVETALATRTSAMHAIAGTTPLEWDGWTIPPAGIEARLCWARDAAGRDRLTPREPGTR